MTSQRSGPCGRRGGYVIAEVAMAVLVLLVAMTLTVRVVGWLARERRSADERLVAIQDVSNALERVTAEPFGKLDSARALEVAKGEKPDEKREWGAEVTDETEKGPRAKRVEVRLRWKSHAGEWVAPVRTRAWVYEDGRPT